MKTDKKTDKACGIAALYQAPAPGRTSRQKPTGTANERAQLCESGIEYKHKFQKLRKCTKRP